MKSEAGPRIVGQVKMVSITEVKPNTWNPNRMTPFMKASLKRGLEEDGWLLSQALLIWGSDEKGKRKNVIIDGEHRWTVGSEIGFKTAPMVFLEKMKEADAKKLTVKLNRKRGEFDPDRLGELLRGIQYELPEDNMGLAIGIEEHELMKLLAEPPTPLPIPDIPAKQGRAELSPDIPASGVRMVQLFFNAEQHKEFARLTKELAAKYKTTNATDTALEAARQMHRQL